MAWKNLNPDMTVDERSKFLSKHKLYYDCYEAISPNIQCLRRRNCKISPAKHAADLHGCKKYDSKSDDDTEKTVKNNCVNTKDLQCESFGPAEVLSMCVVPVKILHNNSEKEMITFA